MDKIQPKRVLLKISGEALMGEKSFGLDPLFLTQLCQDIKAVSQKGIELVLVVGGGNFFRGIGGLNLGIERVTGDHMGMLATVMNALAMQNMLSHLSADSSVMSAISMPTICESYNIKKALQSLEHSKIIICAGGTGGPYFTTDSAAALRAIELQCDVLLKATKVDGIYTKDPLIHSDAEFLPELTYDQALRENLRVMDATAISLARENQLPIIVFSLNEPQAIVRAVQGEGRFSIVK